MLILLYKIIEIILKHINNIISIVFNSINIRFMHSRYYFIDHLDVTLTCNFLS